MRLLGLKVHMRVLKVRLIFFRSDDRARIQRLRTKIMKTMYIGNILRIKKAAKRDTSDDGAPRDDVTHDAVTCVDATSIYDGPTDGGALCDTSDVDHKDICSDDGNGRTNCIGENGEDHGSGCVSSNDEENEHVAYIEALRCRLARDFEGLHTESN